MQQLIHQLVLNLVLTSTLAACGGSTTGGPDGGQSRTGASTGGSTGNSCDVVTVTAVTVSCESAANCVTGSCTAALSQCLGTDYLNGNFGSSPCAEYATCVKGCNCVKSCSDASCALSSTCQTCLNGPMLTCAIQSCAAAYFACTR